MDTDAVMEDAAQNTEAAVEELTKAREHQKASMKCKIIVAAVCGCIVVIAIIVIVIKFYAEAGTMTAQSAQPTTCETGDDTKCLYVAPARSVHEQPFSCCDPKAWLVRFAGTNAV